MGATKRVQVYDAKTDKPLMQFDSVKECAQYFGVDSSYISYNIHGKFKTIKKRQYYCKLIDNIYHTDNTDMIGTHTPKAIDVFTDGVLVDTFDNVKLAANYTGVNPFTIYKWCRGEYKKPVKGYTFQYNSERQIANSKKPVDLYDVETNELFKSFESVKECADFLGLSICTINANLRGDTKTVKVGSFYCKYKT